MMTIDNYCDLAKQNHALKNDSALAEALNLKRNAISNWRTKRAWPNDESMVALAELAGKDPGEALLHLASWRTGGKAHQEWQKLFMTLTGTAAIFALFFVDSSTFFDMSNMQYVCIGGVYATKLNTSYATLYENHDSWLFKLLQPLQRSDSR
ncbi:hypothetical protein [Magnetococcus sp. PR-3]|uniref:hypothetical protein n=1 Tax=Magnetococcus sp. PR-3 TaxID=3120355 RepID=UPI002FCDFFE6